MHNAPPQKAGRRFRENNPGLWHNTFKSCMYQWYSARLCKHSAYMQSIRNSSRHSKWLSTKLDGDFLRNGIFYAANNRWYSLHACDISFTICSSECRDLLIAARLRLGCCVNIFNDSSSGLYDPETFRLTMWPLCGIEPVTEQYVWAQSHWTASTTGRPDVRFPWSIVYTPEYTPI